MAKKKTTNKKNKLIHNYGILWEKRYLHFGLKGRLKGRTNEDNKNELIDFKKQKGIYVLCDKDFMPIYVGQTGKTGNPMYKRLKAHMTGNLINRWEYFSWFGLIDVPRLSNPDEINKIYQIGARDLMDTFEAILIVAMETKFTKQDPIRADSFGADEYWQEPSPKEIADQNTMDKILTEVKSLKDEVKSLRKFK